MGAKAAAWKATQADTSRIRFKVGAPYKHNCTATVVGYPTQV
jgi:hypothetical protein